MSTKEYQRLNDGNKQLKQFQQKIWLQQQQQQQQQQQLKRR